MSHSFPAYLSAAAAAPPRLLSGKPCAYGKLEVYVSVIHCYRTGNLRKNHLKKVAKLILQAVNSKINSNYSVGLRIYCADRKKTFSSQAKTGPCLYNPKHLAVSVISGRGRIYFCLFLCFYCLRFLILLDLRQRGIQNIHELFPCYSLIFKEVFCQ